MLDYNDWLGEQISDAILDGCSLKRIAQMPGMPSKSTILRWAKDPKHPFRAVYREACLLRFSALGLEVLEDVEELPDKEAAIIARTRTDAKLKLMGMFKGTVLGVESAGSDGVEIVNVGGGAEALALGEYEAYERKQKERTGSGSDSIGGEAGAGSAGGDGPGRGPVSGDKRPGDLGSSGGDRPKRWS